MSLNVIVAFGEYFFFVGERIWTCVWDREKGREREKEWKSERDGPSSLSAFAVSVHIDPLSSNWSTGELKKDKTFKLDL